MKSLLIEDIEIYLASHTTIRGFTRERLYDLIKNNMKGIQGYEIRFLLNWSGLYLYQFEQTYEINIDYL